VRTRLLAALAVQWQSGVDSGLGNWPVAVDCLKTPKIIFI